MQSIPTFLFWLFLAEACKTSSSGRPFRPLKAGKMDEDQLYPGRNELYPSSQSSVKSHTSTKDFNHLIIEKLGQASGGSSRLVNFSNWPLARVGSQLLLYSLMSKLGQQYFNPTSVKKASLNDKRQYLSLETNDATPEVDINKSIEKDLKIMAPAINRHVDQAYTLVQDWRAFLANLQESFAADGSTLRSNFLLHFFNGQHAHFEKLKALDEMNKQFAKTESVSETLKKIQDKPARLVFEHFRESIDAVASLQDRSNSTLSEEERNYIKFLTVGSYEFRSPETINICGNDKKGKDRNSRCPDLPTSRRRRNLSDNATTITSFKVPAHTELTTVPTQPLPKQKTVSCFLRWCFDSLVHKWDHRQMVVKRQAVAVGLAGALVVASIAGSYSYTYTETSRIYSALTKTDDALGHLIMSVQISDRNVHKLDQKVDDVGQAVLDICQELQIIKLDQHHAEYTESMNFLYSQLKSAVDSARLAYSDLRSRRFPYSITSQEEIKDLYSEFQAKAVNNEQQLLLQDPLAIYTLPSDLLLIRGRVYLMVSARTRSPESDDLALLHLRSGPIYYNKTEFYISSDYPYVVTDSSFSIFKEMTLQDYQSCDLFFFDDKPFYSCPRQDSIFRRDVQNSCLMQILTYRPEKELAKVCTIRMQPKGDFVEQISHNEFIISSVRPTDSVSVQCPDKRQNTVISFSGQKHVFLPDGCRADSKSHRLYATLDTVSFKNMVALTPKVDIESIISSLGITPEKGIKIIENTLKKRLQENKPKSIHIEEAQQAIREALQMEHSSYYFDKFKFAIFLSVSALISVIALIYCLVKKCTKRRQRRQARRQLRQDMQEMQEIPPDRRLMLAPNVRR